MARRLLERGADPNAINIFLTVGYTPLHHCLTLFGGETTKAMARLLLERGADPNAKNRSGAGPLFYCVQAQRMDYAQLLLEFGVNFAVLQSSRILGGKIVPDPGSATLGKFNNFPRTPFLKNSFCL
jgi:ankyrin repeat protein